MISDARRAPDASAPAPVAGSAGRHGEPHLSGNLATFSPFELLQYLLFSGKTGHLDLERSDGLQASCGVADGAIAEAACGRLRSSEAVLAFVWWRDGSFRFIPGPAPGRCGATSGVESLMMEAVRLADELEALRGRVPPELARLWLKDGAAPPGDDLGCGLEFVVAALRAQPGVTRFDLEGGLDLCPVKVRLSLALLADVLEGPAPRRSSAVGTDEPPGPAALIGGRHAGDRRVLVAHAAQAQRRGLLDAVQDLGEALGSPPARTELSPVGPSFVRFRPPEGGVLSLTLLPISRRNRFLFETFVSSVDAVLFCGFTDGGEEARAWGGIVPPGVSSVIVDETRALRDELRTSVLRLVEAEP